MRLWVYKGSEEVARIVVVMLREEVVFRLPYTWQEGGGR